MMSDYGILTAMRDELAKYDHPPIAQTVRDFYAALVKRVPQEGFELLLPDSNLAETEEQALRSLKEMQYLEFSLKHHAGDGYVYHVQLRGQRFLEVANGQVRSVVVGMTDSGERQTFATGAVRDTAEGKSRPDLISPFALDRVGLWLMLGAQKYSENNWMKGIPVSRCMASLHRHLMKYMQRDTSEDHLAALVTNGIFVLHFEEMVKRGILPDTLLDLPDYEPIPSVHCNGDETLEHEPDEEFRWRKIHDNT